MGFPTLACLSFSCCGSHLLLSHQCSSLKPGPLYFTVPCSLLFSAMYCFVSGDVPKVLMWYMLRSPQGSRCSVLCLHSESAWSTKWVPGQPGLYKETLSQKKNPNKQTNKQTNKEYWRLRALKGSSLFYNFVKLGVSVEKRKKKAWSFDLAQKISLV